MDSLQERKRVFEEFFTSDIFFLIRKEFHPTLAEACIYSLSAGGKRLRPILVLLASGKMDRNSLLLASAVECIHTYSLIHDDLPAMDDDDFRRGIPTNHKKFSESTAILAGDALNSLSFSLLGEVETAESQIHRDLLRILHGGAGGPGMVSGQIEDLEAERTGNHSAELLERIHFRKTGALIVASLLLGNRLRADHAERGGILKEYGENLGILFQLTDDILDEESTFSELGKTPGKDSAHGKLTYPALYGMERAKELRSEYRKRLEELSGRLNPPEDSIFKSLPSTIAQRKN